MHAAPPGIQFTGAIGAVHNHNSQHKQRGSGKGTGVSSEPKGADTLSLSVRPSEAHQGVAVNRTYR